MTRILALALVVCSSTALAQEIGKEIPADQQNTTTPPPDQTPNYDNPYATPPPPPPTPTKKDDAAAVDADGVAGPHKGAFGFRAGFGGGGIPALSTGLGAVAVGAPTFGLRYFVTDSVGLDIDLGLMLAFSSTAAMGFNLGLGVNAFLGRKELPVRPFIHGGFGFGRLTAPLDTSSSFALTFNVGGGGEYWFSDYFSVNARALLGVPVAILQNQTIVTIATFTPGIGGTIYF